MNLIRLTREFVRPYRLLLATVVVLQFVSTVAVLYLPSLNAQIIDRGVARGDIDYIMSAGGLMLVVSLIQIAGSITVVWCGAKLAMSVGRDIRTAIFRQVGSYSTREVQQFGAPSLITRQTNDVQQVQTLLFTVCNFLVAAPIMMIGGVLMAMREDFGLSWLLAVTIPALIGSAAFVVTRMVPAFKAMQERIDDVNRLLREQITGLRVVRAFVREPYETARFADVNAGLTGVAVRAGRWQALLFPSVMVILNLSSVAVIWFGGQRVDSGAMEVGALTAFLAYLVQILISVMIATFTLIQLPRAAVCADRITEVLEVTSSVQPPAEPVRMLSRPGELAFEDVEFSYPGAEHPVLRDISFAVGPGQRIAIIGSTGAGKTTLFNLIPRLIDASRGRITVAGEDVRSIDPEVLWAQIGLVPQKAFLFTGTVASNLRYANPDATDEQLWEALEIAQARDFVAAMSDGLDSAISQGGSNVSGGQRQRLAIARAILKAPAIYLFDDSFSALDLATDARLRAALRPLTRDATVLTVAQRISTIRDADLILVIDDGTVVGRGRHDELVASCPTYREIVASQLSAEEAA
ncbi:MAG: ABC transporter ATP-binding protein [Nocardioides sp.]